MKFGGNQPNAFPDLSAPLGDLISRHEPAKHEIQNFKQNEQQILFKYGVSY